MRVTGATVPRPSASATVAHHALDKRYCLQLVRAGIARQPVESNSKGTSNQESVGQRTGADGAPTAGHGALSDSPKQSLRTGLSRSERDLSLALLGPGDLGESTMRHASAAARCRSPGKRSAARLDTLRGTSTGHAAMTAMDSRSSHTSLIGLTSSELQPVKLREQPPCARGRL